MPVPDEAPPPPVGGATSVYWYRDVDGQRLFCVARYEARRADERKKFYPWTYWTNANGDRDWRAQSAAAPRPLYGLEHLAGRPNSPVLVTEGEKAADAARDLFPDFVVVTSPNGAKAASQAAWSPLAGRAATIWPDADAEGRNYANEVARLAKAGGAASVSIVTIPENWPKGWDLANRVTELPGELTVPDLHRMVAEAREATGCDFFSTRCHWRGRCPHRSLFPSMRSAPHWRRW